MELRKTTKRKSVLIIVFLLIIIIGVSNLGYIANNQRLTNQAGEEKQALSNHMILVAAVTEIMVNGYSKAWSYSIENHQYKFIR